MINEVVQRNLPKPIPPPNSIPKQIKRDEILKREEILKLKTAENELEIELLRAKVLKLARELPENSPSPWTLELYKPTDQEKREARERDDANSEAD